MDRVPVDVDAFPELLPMQEELNAKTSFVEAFNRKCGKPNLNKEFHSKSEIEGIEDSRSTRSIPKYAHSHAQLTLIHQKPVSFGLESKNSSCPNRNPIKRIFSSWCTFSANRRRTCRKNTSISSIATGIDRPCVCVSKPV